MSALIPPKEPAEAQNNLRLLADPFAAGHPNGPMAHISLLLADETCRLYPQQAVDLYLNEIDGAYLPIEDYNFDRVLYPHLSSVKDKVAQHKASGSSSSCPAVGSASLNAARYTRTSPRRSRSGTMNLVNVSVTRNYEGPFHSGMRALNAAVMDVERDSRGQHRSPSTDAEVKIDNHGQGHSSLSGSFASGTKRSYPTANSTVSAATVRPTKRSRATSRPTTESSLQGKLSSQPVLSLGTGQLPAVAGMALMRPCPTAPPGQRDNPAYIKAVRDWITERTKIAKPSQDELDKLLVNNFMCGKIYMRHPCNDEFNEETNMDPELWSSSTGWGKTLVPEATVYSRLTGSEKEQLYDWPDRDLWKALFIIWLRDYTDRYTRVVFYQQCFRCQRGGWSCMVDHEMFTKTDIKHKAGKKGGTFRSACIPCRVSKADCSHSKLAEPLEETRLGIKDLESYWKGEITLSQLFAKRQRPEKEVGPFDPHGVPAHIDPKEDAAFAKIENLEKAHADRLPLIPRRTTITKCQRNAREVRQTRRAERDKAPGGVQEMKKLAMVKYLADRLGNGTLSAPIRCLHLMTWGLTPDFYAMWMGDDSTNTLQPSLNTDNPISGSPEGRIRRSSTSQFLSRVRTRSSSGGSSSPPQFFRGESVPGLDDTRSPTVDPLQLHTPSPVLGALPGDGLVITEPEAESSSGHGSKRPKRLQRVEAKDPLISWSKEWILTSTPHSAS
ncbi:hypothetical protein CcaverHIS002_0301430 [Cutaneotrichosporon cavernicola]|nr:hypothetical protein CcaverHIS002_0301430 [Cutaneotrichosporon cavernicola]